MNPHKKKMKHRVKVIYFLHVRNAKKTTEEEKKTKKTHTQNEMKCRKLMIDLVLSGNNLLHFTINANDILFCLIIMCMLMWRPAAAAAAAALWWRRRRYGV